MRLHTHPRLRALVATAGIASTLLLTACSSGAAPAPAAAPTTASAPAPAAATTAPTTGSAPAAPTTAPAGGAATAAPAAAKVNANTATVAEITKAFEDAGLANANRLAREVEEYRPYPTNDPNLTKLRQNLVKYNLAAGVADKMVSVLTP